ncbi:MAG: large subunit ribosomal protein [Acidobacteriota bacterium]|jgi:large subunit ribosomal protein L28|nr:large subunit ribosomal protein [Acidobacteriota bacterium]
MAKQCEICGKGTVTGRKVSHAHNVTSRTWEPNLRSIKALIGGTVKRVRVCARCIRSGKVQRPPVRDYVATEKSAAAPATPARPAAATKH